MTTSWLEAGLPAAIGFGTGVWGFSPTLIYCTTDGGEIYQWNGTAWTLKFGPDLPLYSVWGASSTVLWAVGGFPGNPSLLKSTDSGATWNQQTPPVGGDQFSSIWGVDANNIFLAGYDGTNFRIWKTTNAGVAWTSIFSSATQSVRGIFGFAANDVYFGGAHKVTGVLLHWNGTTVSPVAGQTVVAGDADAVWGSAVGNVYWGISPSGSPVATQVGHLAAGTIFDESGPWTAIVEMTGVWGAGASGPVYACGFGDANAGAYMFSLTTPNNAAPGTWEEEPLPASARPSANGLAAVWVDVNGFAMAVGMNANGDGTTYYTGRLPPALYGAVIWPGMLYPPFGNSISPTTPESLPFRPNSLRIGGTASPPNAPPMRFPAPTNPSRIGGLAANRGQWLVAVRATAASARVNWTPVAPPATPNTTSGNNTLVLTSPNNYVVTDGVRRATNSLFKIISPTPGSGSGS